MNRKRKKKKKKKKDKAIVSYKTKPYSALCP